MELRKNQISSTEWVEAIKKDIKWMVKGSWALTDIEALGLNDLVTIGGEVQELDRVSDGEWRRYFISYRHSMVFRALAELFEFSYIGFTEHGGIEEA